VVGRQLRRWWEKTRAVSHGNVVQDVIEQPTFACVSALLSFLFSFVLSFSSPLRVNGFSPIEMAICSRNTCSPQIPINPFFRVLAAGPSKIFLNRRVRCLTLTGGG